MKKNIKILFIICILVSTFFINMKVEALLPLSGKVIVIDSGHGGEDPGSVVGEVLEKDINLAISKALELELVSVGASVIQTRDGDYDLSTPNANYRKKSDFDNRIKLINNSGANMYISIHLNYLSNSKYSGAQVFYNKEENKELANLIQEKLNSKRKTKKIPNRTYMYDKLSIPGVLVECGFMSNSGELSLLKTSDYQKKIASLIKDAIVEYY